MSQIFSIICIIVSFESSFSAECDINIGPAGTFGCIEDDRYTGGKQYATCLTNIYIQEKSSTKGQSHMCMIRSSTYCWYQCMGETHNKFSGPISEDCSCNGSPSSTSLPLPEECYSPDGKQCSWYRECLEKKHPCVGKSTGYAIEYAEKFCNLYNDNYDMFSIKGQKWIDSVRKCLQVSLVPAIRPFYDGNCDDIKKIAFESHAPCYVGANGCLSICDLSCADWLKSFWTIKGSIVSSTSESLRGMVDVASSCKERVLTCAVEGAVTIYPFGRMASLVLRLACGLIRFKREANMTKTEDNRIELTEKVTELVAKQLEWKSKEKWITLDSRWTRMSWKIQMFP